MLYPTTRNGTVVTIKFPIDRITLEYFVDLLAYKEDRGTLDFTGITAELISNYVEMYLQRFGIDYLSDEVSRYQAKRNPRLVQIRSFTQGLFPAFYQKKINNLMCSNCNANSYASGVRYRYRYYQHLNDIPRIISVPLCKVCDHAPMVKFKHYTCYQDWPDFKV